MRKQVAAAPKLMTTAIATVAHAAMSAGLSIRSFPQAHFGQ